MPRLLAAGCAAAVSLLFVIGNGEKVLSVASYASGGLYSMIGLCAY